jgi:hypothetical protein
MGVSEDTSVREKARAEIERIRKSTESSFKKAVKERKRAACARLGSRR